MYIYHFVLRKLECILFTNAGGKILDTLINIGFFLKIDIKVSL